jgi:hypothetical protein
VNASSGQTSKFRENEPLQTLSSLCYIQVQTIKSNVVVSKNSVVGNAGPRSANPTQETKAKTNTQKDLVGKSK